MQHNWKANVHAITVDMTWQCYSTEAHSLIKNTVVRVRQQHHPGQSCSVQGGSLHRNASFPCYCQMMPRFLSVVCSWVSLLKAFVTLCKQLMVKYTNISPTDLLSCQVWVLWPMNSPRDIPGTEAQLPCQISFTCETLNNQKQHNSRILFLLNKKNILQHFQNSTSIFSFWHLWKIKITKVGFKIGTLSKWIFQTSH